MIFKKPAKKNIFILFLIFCLILILFQIQTGCKSADSKVKEDKKQPDEDQEKKNKIPFPEPGSHDSGWIEYHGKIEGFSLRLPKGEAGDCYTCHRKNDCIECHYTQAPKDHKNRWRTLGHGLSAGGNRDRCLSCHRQGYCIRCHNETAPRSHKGNWEDKHCQWCHFAGTLKPANNCSVCHKQALHTSAPHPVNSGLNCSDCH